MGQRHQIFVKVPNPAKYMYAADAEKKQLVKEFGKEDFTILVYHNQWLFGRSALVNAMNLLHFASQFKRENKLDPKAWEGRSGYHSPCTIKGVEAYRDATKLVNDIAFIMNFRATNKPWVDAGIGEAWYIGKEDEGIREDFTRGDNNDGITIIDMIENKYCFMNIYEQDNEPRWDVNNLPELQPVDARTYVTAYYGETIETTNPYYFDDHDRSKVTMPVSKQQKIVNTNIKHNKTALKGFDKFELLTLDEIQVMFKKMRLVKPKPKKGTKIKLF